MIFGAKGALQGPYDTAYEAFQALSNGAAESCSDGACGARPPAGTQGRDGTIRAHRGTRRH